MARLRVTFARLVRILGPDPAAIAQSMVALLVSLVATVLAGLVLASAQYRFADLPGLLLLVPAAIAQRGNVFGAMGSRLGTAEVHHLEGRLDEMHDRLETWVLKAAVGNEDPSPLRGLLHLAQASEDIGDQASQMVRLVETGDDIHPVLGVALADADEVVLQVPVAAGSGADGSSLAELRLDATASIVIDRGDLTDCHPVTK